MIFFIIFTSLTLASLAAAVVFLGMAVQTQGLAIRDLQRAYGSLVGQPGQAPEPGQVKENGHAGR